MTKNKSRKGHVARLRQLGKEIDALSEQIAQFAQFKEEMQKEGLWDADEQY